MGSSSTTTDSQLLEVLRRCPHRTMFELSEITGFSAGTLGPALARLEAAGQIVSRWEAVPLPKRQRYRLVVDDVIYAKADASGERS